MNFTFGFSLKIECVTTINLRLGISDNVDKCPFGIRPNSMSFNYLVGFTRSFTDLRNLRFLNLQICLLIPLTLFIIDFCWDAYPNPNIYINYCECVLVEELN